MNPSSSSTGIVVETTALPTYFTEWRAFYEANKLDCKLYEIARSTWRAEIQTIIPLMLQKQRAGEGDDTRRRRAGERRDIHLGRTSGM